MVAGKLARQETFHTADAAGYAATAGDLAHWLERREIYRAAWREFFRDWDILLAPMTLTPAFEHSSVSTADRRLQISGNSVEFDYMSFYPSMATLAGQPAVAFPAGQNQAGLPLGLQAIGPFLEDRTALGFAACWSRRNSEDLNRPAAMTVIFREFVLSHANQPQFN